MQNESKHERFVRMAEARTNKLISMIRLLGNCSNKNTYNYSKEEVRQIFTTLEDELKNAKQRFEMANSSDKEFKLK